MGTPMTAIEMTGTIDEHQQLKLDDRLPITGPRRVRVIVLSPIESERGDWDESEWLGAASHNPAFKFLRDSRENIYSPKDGQPFKDEV